MTQENDLTEYTGAVDATCTWEGISSQKTDTGTLYALRLTSQTWQGRPWTHRLHVYLPYAPVARDWGLLTITSDHVGQAAAADGDLEAACRAGIVGACLYDVPNQPLFDGLREDELLAHTLTQRLDTDDRTWPLLFPMVKAAIRAMDAIAEKCKAEGSTAPARFVLHGASKRGWTAWLTAVADSRVGAIMPEVYDNLNLFAQMPHQVAVWEAYSEMIEDYTEQNLQDKMRTPSGHALALSVDPFTYRAHLTLPKLLIHGLNDRYWATDALNLYWDDLPGDKHVVYAPNQGHYIADRQRIAPTQQAFLRAVTSGTSLPDVAADYEETPTELCVTLRSTVQALEARVWSAASATQDFRESKWTWKPLERQSGRDTFTGAVPRPASGYVAVMGDCLLPDSRGPYTLSTQVRILGVTSA